MAETIPVGAQTFRGGQNAASDPSQINDAEYFAGVNTSCADDVLGPRWGWHQRKLTFPAGGITDRYTKAVLSFEELYYGGRFQAAFPYTVGTTLYIVTVISGVIYLINISTYSVQILSLDDDDYINENTPRVARSPAGQYWVIFDYPNFPVILDGLTARRADPAKNEVPISVLGVYNQNRLAIGNAGNEFTLGDPAGSLATPDAPVTFNEILTPSSSYYLQAFQLSSGLADGPITAMGVLEFVDTSTGIGPLIVATRNSIFTYNTQTPRAQWQNGQFGTSFIATSGVSGHRALQNVNSDFFYVDPEWEVRTASMSRQEQQRWSKTPISREVHNWIEKSNKAYASYAVIGYFKNKVLVTVNPYVTNSFGKSRKALPDVAFGGFVVLELDNQARMLKAPDPVWAGLWTGIRPMEFVSFKNRAFVFSKDPASRNELYEVSTDKRYDLADGNLRQIKSIVYTKEFYGENPWQNKSYKSMDINIEKIQGDFSLAVHYKPNTAENFALLKTFRHFAPWCSNKVLQHCRELLPHQIGKLTVGDPEEQTCNQVTQTTGQIFQGIQFKFEISGVNWRLKNYLARLTEEPQSDLTNACESYTPAEVCGPCNTDWNNGAFQTCQPQKT